jgi:acetate---CoA ligase (ADP-forming)
MSGSRETLSSLEPLFTPRAVALVGSVGEGKLGYELLQQLLAGGYRDVIAVNPKGQGALGVTGCASVVEAGLPLDLAVIASPAGTVAPVLEECGQAGVRAAVVISSGFGEMGNKAGEEEIKAVAAQHGIRIVGPNCAGVINTAHSLCPTLETLPPAGHVAIISQSGALAGVLLGWAKRDGLGISKFVSYGNRADVNEVDLLEYLADDPETHVVCVYIETVSNGRAFMAAAARCAAAKPVIVIKAGRGESGQRATLSHTGSLAGSDAVYDAALIQCGAIRVTSAEEMFDLCRALTGLPRLAGRRVAIITNSGGPSILAADKAEAAGLVVAEPGAEIRARLSAFLPAHAALKNPIDLTVEGTEKGYRETLKALFATEGTENAEGTGESNQAFASAAGKPFDVAVAINIAPPYLDSVPIARGIIDAARATGKPVVTSFLPEAVTAEAVDWLGENGILNFPTPERAVVALANMARIGERLTGRRFAEPNGANAAAERTALPPAPVLEPDAMLWLSSNGIATPVFIFAESEDEAAAACYGVGYPAVMKVVSPDILHKSERGGVIAGIRDEGAAREAFRTIRLRAEGARFTGVIVYPLIRNSQEVLIGLSRDPQFGPVVAFGLGGIYTEVFADVALRVAPVDHGEAHAMIRSIRGYRLLAGARGQKPADLHALADFIVRVSELPFAYPELVELDLNPVFASPAGAVAGDVRIIRGEPWSSRNVA